MFTNPRNGQKHEDVDDQRCREKVTGGRFTEVEQDDKHHHQRCSQWNEGCRTVRHDIPARIIEDDVDRQKKLEEVKPDRTGGDRQTGDE